MMCEFLMSIKWNLNVINVKKKRRESVFTGGKFDKFCNYFVESGNQNNMGLRFFLKRFLQLLLKKSYFFLIPGVSYKHVYISYIFFLSTISLVFLLSLSHCVVPCYFCFGFCLSTFFLVYVLTVPCPLCRVARPHSSLIKQIGQNNANAPHHQSATLVIG